MEFRVGLYIMKTWKNLLVRGFYNFSVFFQNNKKTFFYQNATRERERGGCKHEWRKKGNRPRKKNTNILFHKDPKHACMIFLYANKQCLHVRRFCLRLGSPPRHASLGRGFVLDVDLTVVSILQFRHHLPALPTFQQPCQQTQIFLWQEWIFSISETLFHIL